MEHLGWFVFIISSLAFVTFLLLLIFSVASLRARVLMKKMEGLGLFVSVITGVATILMVGDQDIWKGSFMVSLSVLGCSVTKFRLWNMMRSQNFEVPKLSDIHSWLIILRNLSDIALAVSYSTYSGLVLSSVIRKVDVNKDARLLNVKIALAVFSAISGILRRLIDDGWFLETVIGGGTEVVSVGNEQALTTIDGSAALLINIWDKDFASTIMQHHLHLPSSSQCSSLSTAYIKASVHVVWYFVRSSLPNKYKSLVSEEVNLRSGLPAIIETERLELADNEEYVFGMKIVGGDHSLKNYTSVITVQPDIIDGRPGTVVIESFVVDVLEGCSKEETCSLVEAILKSNLSLLADLCEL